MKHQDVRKMTREIKFRAWDEEKREMFEVSGMRWKDGMVTGDDTWYGDDFLSPAERVSSTLMQYTGLKDKNGVEVYEGDIVNVDGYVGKVFYDQYCWSVKNNTEYFYKAHYDLPHDPFSEGKFEVIGNIYENPHLLEDHEQTS